MSQFARARQALSGLGIPHEMEVKYQTEPRDGWMASWTSDEGCAIIFGLAGYVVDFIFNGIGDFERINVSERKPEPEKPEWPPKYNPFDPVVGIV